MVGGGWWVMGDEVETSVPEIALFNCDRLALGKTGVK